MSYKFEKIDPENESADYWQRFYEHEKKGCEFRKVKFKKQTVQQFKSSFQSWLRNGGGTYLVWKNEEAAGSFGCYISFKEDLEKRRIDFLNRLIDSSVEEELIKGVLKCLLDFDPKSAYLYIKSENGNADFIPSKLGVESDDHRSLLEWNLSNINKDELLEKFQNQKKQYSTYSLKLYELLPDEILKSFCNLYVKTCKQSPGFPDAANYDLSEAALKKQQDTITEWNQLELRYLLYDETDALIGLTSVGLNKNNTKIAYQHMTGISEKFRGRGLGKYLKLAMILELMNRYPDLQKLETEIHPHNKISITMNESMGYETTGHRTVYLIPRTRMEAWLDKYD